MCPKSCCLKGSEKWVCLHHTPYVCTRIIQCQQDHGKGGTYRLMYRCFIFCHGDQSCAEFFVSPHLIRLSRGALIVEPSCCVSPLSLWLLSAAQERRIQANPRARTAQCLWSQELWRQISWFREKRCLWNAAAWRTSHVWPSRVKDVRKRQGCEKWGVNNITALNITIINLYSRAEAPPGGRARLGNLQRVT